MVLGVYDMIFIVLGNIKTIQWSSSGLRLRIVLQ